MSDLLVNRRTLLKGTTATLALAPSFGRGVMAATSAINAVRLLQGGVGKIWSTIYGDTRTLGFPVSAIGIFMNIAAVVRNSMPHGLPAIYNLVGIYDAAGHPVFQVNLLPPNTAIPNSISNPMLQVLMTAGSQAGASYASYVVPEFTTIDGAYKTWQFSVGMLPVLTPARFMVTAAELDNATGVFKFGPGYWTNKAATAPLASQLPPPAFNIPMISSGLANDTNMVFSIGGPMKDRLGGYGPYGGSNQDLFSAPIDYTQLYFSARPPSGSPPPIIFPSFARMNGYPSAILSAINTSNIYAAAAEQLASLLMQAPPPATPVQAVWNEVATLSSSLASTITTATKNGASPGTLASLMSAQSSVGQAQQLLSSMPVTSPPAVDLETVYLLMLAAYDDTAAAAASGAADLAGKIQSAYTVPLVNTVNGVRTVTSVNSVGPATVISEGNGVAYTTFLNAGNIVQVDNGTGTSALNNQVNNVTMYNGGAPIQPAASDPHVTIENIVTTPYVP